MGAIALQSPSPLQDFDYLTKTMKRIPKSSLDETAQLSGLQAASERAGIELSEFINFIQINNPGIGRAAATMTTAYYLYHLPAILLNDPKAMEDLRAIATEFQS